jgi:hypothetical protein
VQEKERLLSPAALLVRTEVPSPHVPRPVLHAVSPPAGDVAAILAEAARTARDVLSADVSLVLVADGRRAGLVMAAQAGLDDEVAAALGGPVECKLARLAIREGRTVRSAGLAVGESGGLVGAATGIRSALVVPLAGPDGRTGVLAVGARDDRAFGDGDVAVLELVARNAAGAIDNLRLQADQQSYTEELQREYAAMRRAREAHEQLVRASLDGARLDELVAVLATLAGVPLVLTNAQGTRIASGAPEGGPDVDVLWESCRSRPAFTRCLADGAAPQDVAATAPWRVVPVVAGSETLAFLVVPDASGLAGHDLVVVEESGAVLAAALLRELSVVAAEARLHGGLLESLVGAGGSGTVETRAALLGIDLRAPQCVVAMPRSEGGGPDLAVAIAAGQSACARIGVRGVFAQLDEAIVALLVSGDRCVSREVVEEWIDAYKAELAQRGAEAPEAVGVSAVPMARGEFREGIAGAQQALRVGHICRRGEVTFLQEVELLAVFADSMKHEQLKGYVGHCLGELLAYDARTNSQLAHTLEVYLDHSCVARHAAAALHLHPHSLRYRLRRIEELQGLNLQDPFARLTAHLATKVRPLFDDAARVSH